MVILPVHQGTEQWYAARSKYYRTASRAPTVMRANKYQTYDDLLSEIKFGVTREIDANTQALFDAGHFSEEAARKIVEAHLHKQYGHSVPLLPLTCLTDDEYLLASSDGMNEDLRIGFEHKLANEKLFAQIRAKDLDPCYTWQLEQLILVGNLDYIIFMCSDGTKERAAFIKYVPVKGRREQLLAGWKQFDADLLDYQHVEVLPVVTAAPVMALPALSIQVNGSITLIDNLAVFGEGLKDFIAQIPEKPSTDLEFVTCKAACAKLQEAQDALDAGEAHALGQIQSFDQMRRTKALLYDLARNTRLAVEKMVAAREQQIKYEIVQKAKSLYDAHVESLKAETGGPWIVISPPDFAGTVKNKRTVASLQNAVDTALANGKIAADASAKLIRANLACLKGDGAGFEFLFSDRLALISKPIDDLRILIKSRIADHKTVEAERIEAERDKIRAEEAQKLKNEAAKFEIKRLAEQEARITAEIEACKAQEAAQKTAAPQVKLTTSSETALNVEDHPATAAAPITGVDRLFSLIHEALADMSAGELQRALDALRTIRAARA